MATRRTIHASEYAMDLFNDDDLSDLLSVALVEFRQRFGDLTAIANLELQAEWIRLELLGVVGKQRRGMWAGSTDPQDGTGRPPAAP